MNRRGSILVAVLLMASLLVIFVGVASKRLWVASTAGRSANEDIAADMAVRGAVEQIYARTGGRFADMTAVASFRYAGLTVEAAAVDEGARVDLNLGGVELIAGLFRAVGVDAASAAGFAAVIVDWRRDPAVDEETKRATDVRPHGPIEHIRQLDQIPLIPREAIRAIEPFATVASLRARVSPMVAPATVIAALPGMNPARVEEFMGERRAWSGKFEDLMKRYGIVQDHVSKDGGPTTRLSMVVRIGSHRIRGYEVIVAVLPGDDEPYRFVSWNGNILPAGVAGPRP